MFFFFSSRRRHTRSLCDWSSDVCSSDLPDGRTIAISDFFRKLLFFDARSYDPIGEPLRVAEWVDGIAYSPDGETIAFGGSYYLTLIDARTRKTLEQAALNGHAARMAFTRDGSK